MKALNLTIFIIAIAIIFSGCAKEQIVTSETDQDNQATTSLKATQSQTHFTGTCTLIHFAPVNAWYDDTDDIRVTGVSIWVTESVVQIDEVTYELSGTAELFVGAEVVGDEYDGKWDMTWKGTQTLTSPEGFRIVAHAVGAGTEGIVDGLTAKWKYTMDFDGTPETMFYAIKGKIKEAP